MNQETCVRLQTVSGLTFRYRGCITYCLQADTTAGSIYARIWNVGVIMDGCQWLGDINVDISSHWIVISPFLTTLVCSLHHITLVDDKGVFSPAAAWGGGHDAPDTYPTWGTAGSSSRDVGTFMHVTHRCIVCDLLPSTMQAVRGSHPTSWCGS